MVAFQLTLALCCLIAIVASIANVDPYFDSVTSPRLFNCKKKTMTLQKVTEKRFLVAAMFKDEEGFLAEFLAFYKVHGFERVLLWDHGSTDGYMNEILPWLAEGFAFVKNASDAYATLVHRKENSGNKFTRVMILKRELERLSIMYAIRNGFDYYLSADLDEYVLPTFDASGVALTKPIPYVTVADAIENVFVGVDPVRNITRPWRPKLYMPILKYNYPGVPHVLEPVDQLLIESYLTRFSKVKSTNFYATVQAKYVYKLTGAEWEHGDPSTIKMPDGKCFNQAMGLNLTDTKAFLSNCCFFHGCEFNRRNKAAMCSVLEKSINMSTTFELNPFRQKHAVFGLRMNHYARSFEKFAVKARTWETANHIDNDGYDLKEYMNRAFGWEFDPVALMYSCDVRREISRARARAARSAGVTISSSVDNPVCEHCYVRFGTQWRRSGKEGVGVEGQNITSNRPMPFNPTAIISYSSTGDDSMIPTFLDYYEL